MSLTIIYMPLILITRSINLLVQSQGLFLYLFYLFCVKIYIL
nr:MAG TPA: hypothetical protein [Caudoviricetes sp.]